MKTPRITQDAIEAGLLDRANKDVFNPNGFHLLADGEVDQLGSPYKIHDLYFARRTASGLIITKIPQGEGKKEIHVQS